MSKTASFHASQDLSAGSLTHDVVIGTDTPNVEGSFKIASVALKAASAISQVVTLSVIKAEGSAYTDVINTETLSSDQNYTHSPSGDRILRRGDTVRLTCANSGTPSIVVSSTIELVRVD